MRNHKLKIISLVILLAVIAVVAIPSQGKTEIAVVFNGLVFVKNPPSTDQDKIAWWNANKEQLNHKYHLVSNDRFFTVIVMDFADGYEALPHADFISGGGEDDYSCNSDIHGDKKCIKKKTSFKIQGNLTQKVYIDVDDKKTYIQTPEGKMVEHSRN